MLEISMEDHFLLLLALDGAGDTRIIIIRQCKSSLHLSS